MAKNDQEEAFEKLLTTTLSRTIEFVKFAETKNAALLTFASAWILACVNLIYGTNEVGPEWKAALKYAASFFFLGALASFSTFVPITQMFKFHKDVEKKKSLIYFDHITAHSSFDFRDKVRALYFPRDDHSATEDYLNDLIFQIHVNSCIASRKFRFFRLSAWLVIFGILIVFIFSPWVASFFRSLKAFIA